jgi:hypothetical protein
MTTPIFFIVDTGGDDYIYYQTDDMNKEEAHAAIEATCILYWPGSVLKRGPGSFSRAFF